MLHISESEVSESIYRSEYAGLLLDTKSKKVNKKAFFDFLQYGIRYVFPVRPSGIGRGIATAHAAFPLNQSVISEEIYVWACPEGNARGLIIEPLYPTLTKLVLENQPLYELLTLIEGIRTGSARVYQLAVEELKKRILTA